MKHQLDNIAYAQEYAKKICIDEKCVDWHKQTLMNISFQQFPLDFRSKEGRLFREKCKYINNTLQLKKFTTILSKLPIIKKQKEIMKNVNKEVQDTLTSLYVDFNGNSTRVEKYLNKRIDLFNRLEMKEAKLFYESVSLAFDIKELQDEEIRKANAVDSRDAHRSGWDYGIR